MSKKLLALLLALAMVVSMITIPVSATETEEAPQETTEPAPEETTEETPDETESTESDHVHCVCGGAPTAAAANHVCADVTWTPISEALEAAGLTAETADFGKLPTGNYYLDSDLVVTGLTSTSDKHIALCLNGNDITTTKHKVFPNITRVTLEITDHYDAASQTWGGTIYGGSFEYGGIIYTNDNTTLNIYGGNFTDGDATRVHKNGGLIAVASEDHKLDAAYKTVMNIYNGKIYGAKSETAGLITVFHCCDLNIYGGTLAEGSVTGTGGLIAFSSEGQLNVYGGLLTGGVATTTGGAVYMTKGTMYIKGGTIVGNSAANGGAVGVYAGSKNETTGKGYSVNVYVEGGKFHTAEGYNAATTNHATTSGGHFFMQGVLGGATLHVKPGADISWGYTEGAAKESDMLGGNIRCYDGIVYMTGGTVSNGKSFNGGNIAFKGSAGYQQVSTMSGGTITEGKAVCAKYTASGPYPMGGNIYVNTNEKFILSGSGTISEGTADHAGGDVCLDSNAKMEMTGGTISGGFAAYGGNIAMGNSANVQMTVSGGTISGGDLDRTVVKTGNGHCIRVQTTAQLTLKGKPVIEEIFFVSASGTKLNATEMESLKTPINICVDKNIKNFAFATVDENLSSNFLFNARSYTAETNTHNKSIPAGHAHYNAEAGTLYVNRHERTTGSCMQLVAAKDATCGEAGYEAYYKCLDCTYTTNITPIAKLDDHTYDDDMDVDCNVCGEEREIPFGTENNPIVIGDPQELTGVEAKAGTSTYYAISSMLNGMILTVVATDGMTVTLNGTALVENADGLYQTELNGEEGNVLIITAGDKDVAVNAAIEPPLGTENNPYRIDKMDDEVAIYIEKDQQVYILINSQLNGNLVQITGATYANLNRIAITADEYGIFSSTFSGSPTNKLLVFNAEEDSAYLYVTIKEPFGSESNPVVLLNEEETVTNSGTMYYQGYFNNVDVTISGEGAFSVISEGETIAAVDGKVTLSYPAVLGRPSANVFAIVGDGEFTIEVKAPMGTMSNPAALVMGENTATVSAGSNGYFYEWTAPAAGTLTITMPDGNWTYAITNKTLNQTGDTQWSDSDPVVKEASVEVAAGNVIQIMVNKYNPNSPFNAPAGSLTFTASFEKKVEKFSIKFARLVLANEINMQFAFEKGELDWTGAYAEIEKDYVGGDTKTQTVALDNWGSATIKGVEHYVVYFSGIAAKEMGDEIRVTIFNAEGEAISEVWVDSIQRYIMRTIDTTKATEQKLFADMLYYGAAAQDFFNYNEENLVTAAMTDAQKALASTSVTTENNQVQGPNYAKTRLTLTNRIELQVAFENVDSTMRAEYSFTDHRGNAWTFSVAGSEFVYADGWALVTVDTQALSDARQEVTVKVYNAAGEEVASAVDSVESYVNRNAENATMKPEELLLHQRIMMFANSAYEHFHEQS